MAVKDLFNTISADDILKEEQDQWLFMGNPLNEAVRNMIINEAVVFEQGKLWDILKADIRFQSNKLMYEKSKTEMDMISGKFILWTLDIIKTRLKSMKKQKGDYNRPTSSR